MLTGAVLAVAGADICQHRGRGRGLTTAVQLFGAAARALLGGGRQEDLYRRVGEHHGSDVAALQHRRSPLSQLALVAAHGVAYRPPGRNPGCQVTDPVFADRRRHILPIQQHLYPPRGIGHQVDAGVGTQSGQGLVVVQGHP